jgi:hypothetical protein
MGFLPLVRGPGSRWLDVLRRLPFVAALAPPPQALEWGRLTVYWVRPEVVRGVVGDTDELVA